MQPLPCRVLWAGMWFLEGAWCVAAVLVIAARSASFGKMDALTPQRAPRHQGRAGVSLVGRGVLRPRLWAAGRLLRGTEETRFLRGLWVSGCPLPSTTQSDVRVGTRALLCRRSLRAGTEERFVIKALVFEHILLSLLGRPPTFLAEEVLGSAEFCREFLAFMIHVKINVLSRCDLVGLSGPSPGPASAAAA